MQDVHDKVIFLAAFCKNVIVYFTKYVSESSPSDPEPWAYFRGWFPG